MESQNDEVLFPRVWYTAEIDGAPRRRYRPSGPIAADKPPERAVSRRSFLHTVRRCFGASRFAERAWPRQNSVRKNRHVAGRQMKFTAKLIAAFIARHVLIPVYSLGYLSYSSRKPPWRSRPSRLTLIADAGKASSTAFELIKGRALDFSSDGFIRDAAEALRTPDARDPRGAELRNRWTPFEAQ